MAKLYIFGIGGTGSRVIRALTMLLASGVKIHESITKIIPIIIDPDIANGDMNRTLQTLKIYQDLKNDLEGNSSDFFNARIETLSQQTNSNLPNRTDYFQFKIEGTENETFKDFIGKELLSEDKSTQSLTDLLFSKENQENHMNQGFLGNPNVGSVVLNQLAKNPQYKDFAQRFEKGDKIFIISSIFGGTGAAGFPLLLKNLRQGAVEIPNSEDIKNSCIGALSVLPYFNVENNDESAIDSATFREKTKAALHYYNATIVEPKKINALYYIGDNAVKVYENNQGSGAQKNKAHFIELAGALSIIDFCNIEGLITENGQSFAVEVKEFGVNKSDNSSLNFSDLGIGTRELIANPLSKFKLMCNYLNDGLDKGLVSNWAKMTPYTNKQYFESDNYRQSLQAFTKLFEEWLVEMKENEQAFIPFIEVKTNSNALHFISGKTPQKSSFFSKPSYATLDKELNSCYAEILKTSTNGNQQLLRMFETATTRVLGNHKLLV